MSAPGPTLSPAELLELTYQLATGRSWDEVAAERRRPAAELRRAARAHPDYEAAQTRAAREVDAEARAELVCSLRQQLRDPDPKAVRAATAGLAQVLADAGRDRTRVEVERVRAEVARERLQARAAKEKAAADEPSPFLPSEPPEVLEARIAQRAAAGQSVVWLWGGKHAIGGTEPDPSDTPLMLFEDHTVIGRHLFWAARTDPTRGPVEPVPALAPDQVVRSGAVGAKQSDFP